MCQLLGCFSFLVLFTGSGRNSPYRGGIKQEWPLSSCLWNYLLWDWSRLLSRADFSRQGATTQSPRDLQGLTPCPKYDRYLMIIKLECVVSMISVFIVYIKSTGLPSANISNLALAEIYKLLSEARMFWEQLGWWDLPTRVAFLGTWLWRIKAIFLAHVFLWQWGFPQQKRGIGRPLNSLSPLKHFCQTQALAKAGWPLEAEAGRLLGPVGWCPEQMGSPAC